MALWGATIPGQSGPGSNGNEGVHCVPQSSSITRISPSDCLVPYPGHSFGKCLSLCRIIVGVFYSHSRLSKHRADEYKSLLFSKHWCIQEGDQPYNLAVSPSYLVSLTWIICEMEGKWPYSGCFMRCFFQHSFKAARSILVSVPSSFFQQTFR